MQELQADPTDIQNPDPIPGTLAPAIVTQSKVWKPESKDASEVPPSTVLECLKGLVEACADGDLAARRVSVLQAWEARHFDRGYQYLLTDTTGGWKIIGADKATKGNPQAEQDDANLYATNVYAAQGDITIGALCRGAIKVKFAAKNKQPINVQCADECNKYKFLWEKNNEASDLQRALMGLAWTDPRGFLWTRSMVDKARFGTNDDGSLRTVEVTTAHGVLETKLPMMADTLEQCSYAQVFEDIDYALARAMYPWMGKKIKASWGTFGQSEFERIARINTRIGVTGKSMAGTSGIRETTIGYTWLRPAMYFDDKVQDQDKQWLLTNCPSGVLVTMAGQELCCFWEESVDDHGSLGMWARGFGQNRRALGSSDIPLQKRTNIWIDLIDKFIRKAIPFVMIDDQAFDADAIANHEANPQQFVSVVVAEGRPITDLTAASPSVTPQPQHMDLIQWMSGPLMQSIDGATPALFGMTDGEDTVGGTQIRLQQALERIGPPWLVANKMYAKACGQAARCCAENSTGPISDNVDGEGEITVDPQNMKGDAHCSPETTNGIPESGAQRQAKIVQILDMASSNPQIASLIATPSNAREIVKGLDIEDVITIDEAESVDKQLEEIEELINAVPLPNPAYHDLTEQIQQLNQQHEAARALAMQAPEQVTPEHLDAGEAMEQQLQQLQQQLQSTPQLIPSVPVASSDDPNDPNYYTTEDHPTEDATCFTWAQEPDGRKMRASKDPKTQLHYLNFSLHWSLHRQMKDKINAQNQIQPKTSINIAADKLTGSAQSQALQKAGIQISPQDADTPHEQETETIERTPFAEIKNKVRRRV